MVGKKEKKRKEKGIDAVKEQEGEVVWFGIINEANMGFFHIGKGAHHDNGRAHLCGWGGRASN